MTFPNPLAVADRFVQSTVDQLSQALWRLGVPRYLQIHACNVVWCLIWIARGVFDQSLWLLLMALVVAVASEANRREDARAEGTAAISRAESRRDVVRHWGWRLFWVAMIAWVANEDARPYLATAGAALMLLESYVVNAPRFPPAKRRDVPVARAAWGHS